MDEAICNKGFTMSDNAIMDGIILECGCKEYALYMKLLSRRNTITGLCFPSIAVLAKDIGCTTRTIQTLLNSLLDKNYIIINSGKTGINNNYFFPKEKFYKHEGNGAVRKNNVLSKNLDKQIKKRNKNT